MPPPSITSWPCLKISTESQSYASASFHKGQKIGHPSIHYSTLHQKLNSVCPIKGGR